MLDVKGAGWKKRLCCWVAEVTTGSAWLSGVSLIVEGALLPGHGLDGPWHRGRLERGSAVRMERVAYRVDGGEGPLGGQGESVLVLLQGRQVQQGGGGQPERGGRKTEGENISVSTEAFRKMKHT